MPTLPECAKIIELCDRADKDVLKVIASGKGSPSSKEDSINNSNTSSAFFSAALKILLVRVW